MYFRSRARMASVGVLFFSLSIGSSACLKQGNDSGSGPFQNAVCVSNIPFQINTGSTGSAYVFDPDPVASSGNPNLSASASSTSFDSFREQVQLSNLGGHGVLEGAYVDIRTSLGCTEGFGAFDLNNKYLYSHSSPYFGEAMSYYFGDRFRSKIDEAGTLAPIAPLRIVAHCMQDDNAFFVRGRDRSGALVEKVCLGDSVMTPGATFTDDATVVIHEAQHGTTVDTYSNSSDLNQFLYDEAGSLNEAISDFVSLSFLEPSIPSSMDPRLFSRWALGKFLGGYNGVRGAHKCPTYSSDYPECAQYGNFSADHNTVSYSYPDGMGWPYGNNFSGPAYVASAFKNYTSQEEIHNAGMVMVGALWDMYQALKDVKGGNQDAAFIASHKLVSESLRRQAKPTFARISPVTFVSFASGIIDAANAFGMSGAEVAAVTNALKQRGLYNGPSVSGGWASVGAGSSESPGVKIMDNGPLLKRWIARLGGDTNIVPPGVGTLNGRLDRGEVAVIWFDIQNNSSNGVTASGLQLTVTSDDPNVTMLNDWYNFGAVSSSSAQIQYSKVNGTQVVNALSSSNKTFHVPTGNSYFATNPYFSSTSTTGVWVRVAPGATRRTMRFNVDIKPANGNSTSLSFPVTIQ